MISTWRPLALHGGGTCRVESSHITSHGDRPLASHDGGNCVESSHITSHGDRPLVSRRHLSCRVTSGGSTCRVESHGDRPLASGGGTCVTTLSIAPIHHAMYVWISPPESIFIYPSSIIARWPRGSRGSLHSRLTSSRMLTMALRLTTLNRIVYSIITHDLCVFKL